MPTFGLVIIASSGQNTAQGIGHFAAAGRAAQIARHSDAFGQHGFHRLFNPRRGLAKPGITMPPAVAAPRSEMMSPNMFSATITS